MPETNIVFESAHHKNPLWLYLPLVIWRGVPPTMESMTKICVNPADTSPIPSDRHDRRSITLPGAAHCAPFGRSGSLTARIGLLSSILALKAMCLPSGDQRRLPGVSSSLVN